MKRRPTTQTPADTFEAVRTVGLALLDVEATTKYDGSPVLKVGGSFMAGLATHRSAEPKTLVVRVGRSARLAVRVMAPDLGEGTKLQPTSKMASTARMIP